jgi:hypothetical protein
VGERAQHLIDIGGHYLFVDKRCNRYARVLERRAACALNTRDDRVMPRGGRVRSQTLREIRRCGLGWLRVTDLLRPDLRADDCRSRQSEDQAPSLSGRTC